VPEGALSANAGRGPWGLIVYPVTAVSSIPLYRDFPEGHCCVGVTPIIAVLDRDPGGQFGADIPITGWIHCTQQFNTARKVCPPF
jgi:hypothetical protein